MANKWYDNCSFDGRNGLAVEEIVFEDNAKNAPHFVNTADDLTRVREGDYVVHGLKKAPKGYHSQTIGMVVRKNDNRLTLGDSREAVVEVDEFEEYGSDENDYVEAPVKRVPRKAASETASEEPKK